MGWHTEKRGSRPPLRVKPHIDWIGGVWLCGIDDTIGSGSTPGAAYRAWCLDVASKFQGWAS